MHVDSDASWQGILSLDDRQDVTFIRTLVLHPATGSASSRVESGPSAPRQASASGVKSASKPRGRLSSGPYDRNPAVGKRSSSTARTASSREATTAAHADSARTSRVSPTAMARAQALATVVQRLRDDAPSPSSLAARQRDGYQRDRERQYRADLASSRAHLPTTSTPVAVPSPAVASNVAVDEGPMIIVFVHRPLARGHYKHSAYHATRRSEPAVADFYTTIGQIRDGAAQAWQVRPSDMHITCARRSILSSSTQSFRSRRQRQRVDEAFHGLPSARGRLSRGAYSSLCAIARRAAMMAFILRSPTASSTWPALVMQDGARLARAGGQAALSGRVLGGSAPPRTRRISPSTTQPCQRISSAGRADWSWPVGRHGPGVIRWDLSAFARFVAP